MERKGTRSALVLPAVIAALLVAGCGGSKDDPATPTRTAARTTTATPTPTDTATPTPTRCENLSISPSIRAELEAVITTLRKGSVFYGRCGQQEWAEGVTQVVLPDGQEIEGEYYKFFRRSSDQPWQPDGAGSGDRSAALCQVPRDLVRKWHGEPAAENCARRKRDSGQ